MLLHWFAIAGLGPAPRVVYGIEGHLAAFRRLLYEIFGISARPRSASGKGAAVCRLFGVQRHILFITLP